MCQVTSSAISTSRRNDVVIAAKGFVLGASVVASLFVLEDLVSNANGHSAKSLRGSPDANASPTTNTDTVFHSSVEQDVISEPKESNNDFLEATTHSPHGEVVSYVPSAAPSTPIPTYMPTAADEIPTDMPTQFDNDAISPLIKLRSSNEVGFRLKLYWETGYFWQEKVTEKFWCMSCPSEECKRNDKMELRDCKKKSDQDAQFVATSTGKGHQFRVANSNLCLQKNSRGRAIKLKPCNAKNKLQHFEGFKSDGEKFDLRPSSSTKRCLSQHHHPKSGEIIYAETCHKAHRVDTGYWVAY